MDAVLELVTAYGAPFIFVALVLGIIGLPIPDETLLVFAGVLIAQDKLNAVETYAAAVLGSWCGTTGSYWIGRTLGFGAMRRFGKYFRLDERRLEEVHHWFHRAGHWTLFFGYYIAGVRHFTAMTAGAALLEFRSFALYAWPGGLIWVSLFLTLGYFAGENWRAVWDVLGKYLHYLTGAILVAILVFVLVRWKRRSRRPVRPADASSAESIEEQSRHSK